MSLAVCAALVATLLVVAPSPPGDGGRAAAFPGQDGLIVFSSDVDGDREIFTVRADGTGIQKLTNNTADDDAPVWSADGTRIAFTSDRTGDDEVWVMSADGSGQVNVTGHPARDQAPAWSPDGRRIAFHSDRAGGSFEIWVMGADGAQPTQLTSNPPLVNAVPSWSPDGSRILFQSGRDLNAELYWMNPDGSDQQRLTNHPAVDREATWSPDGASIAFESDRDGDFEVFTMAAQPGAPAVQLTTLGAYDGVPAWSPSGTRIVFQTSRDATNDIYVVPAAGGSALPLAATPGQDRSPDWQPTNPPPPLPGVAPAVQVDSVTPDTARVSATITPNGAETSVWFEYGPTPAYGGTTTPQSAGAGLGSVAVAETLTGLAENSRYHVRVVAANARGRTTGPDVVVLTPPGPAVVTLPPADRPGQRRAVARGRIDPRGLAGLRYHFEYGTTASYGGRTPSAPVPPGGPLDVSATLDGLRPRTVYHYRLLVEGAGRPRAGDDQTLATAGPDLVESALTPRLVCPRGACRFIGPARLLVRLRDGGTGRFLGPARRRALLVSVRSSVPRANRAIPLRPRVRTRSLRSRRVVLRARTARGSATLLDLAPLLRGARFPRRARLAISVTGRGVRGVVHEIRFVGAPRYVVRRDCTLRPGDRRPRACRPIA